mgnify:CR=1 FL=1
MWAVRVDAVLGDAVDEDLIEAIRDRLAPRHAAAGVARGGGEPVPGRITVQLSVDARTLRQAADAAAREVTDALRERGRTARLTRLEAMPEDELDAELRASVELMGVREIADVAGVSRQRADQLTKRGDFPRPLAELAAGAVWDGAAVRRWLAAWTRKAGRPRKAAAE